MTTFGGMFRTEAEDGFIAILKQQQTHNATKTDLLQNLWLKRRQTQTFHWNLKPICISFHWDDLSYDTLLMHLSLNQQPYF